MLIEKVTIFVTREREGRQDLLLLRHPYAGVQLPAGTVEPGEIPEAAALRETAEETGLSAVTIAAHLGAEDWLPPGNHRPLVAPASVYARPDTTSFAWARLPRGSGVDVLRRQPPFAHVTYEEWDDTGNPRYLTYQITGWVEAAALGQGVRRYFFHLQTAEPTPAEWPVYTDNHHFTLFWAPFSALPPLSSYQQDWLRHFPGTTLLPGPPRRRR
jgi:8-oxo-dGTP pyrophosphatase MutT (NUDIX family)